MLTALMFAAVAVSQPSTVTIEQVSTLPPAEIGKRLLGRTRLPIVRAYVSYEHLEPPLSPGATTVTRVVLFEKATDSAEEGFCQQVRYMVRLKPVVVDAHGKLPPAPSALVTPSTLYRWKSASESSPACEAKGHEFLSVSDTDAKALFAVIRLLAEVQNEAQDDLPMQLSGTVDDEEGRDGFYAPGEAGPITDWKKALREFPVSEIDWQRPRDWTSSGFAWSLRARDWSVDVTYGGDGIRHLSFRRVLRGPF